MNNSAPSASALLLCLVVDFFSSALRNWLTNHALVLEREPCCLLAGFEEDEFLALADLDRHAGSVWEIGGLEELGVFFNCGAVFLCAAAEEGLDDAADELGLHFRAWWQAEF